MKILNIILSILGMKQKSVPLYKPPRPKISKKKGIVVAKRLKGKDLKNYVYTEGWEARNDYCPVCHNTLIPVPPSNYVFKKRTGDYWISCDGFAIVSEKFRRFCIERGYPNLIFTPIKKSKGYYFFTTNEIYKLDYDRSNVGYGVKRECCGNYDYIIRPPRYRSKDESIHKDDFICRAETLFGSYANKSYVIVVGVATVKLMEKYGISKLYFEDIYE